MEFAFINMVEIVFIAIIAISTAIWLITHWIKSATSAKIRAELEKEYQEKHKRLKSEFAEKEAAIAERERKAAYHLERETSFASRWQQLIDRERKVEERERKVEGKGLDNALDRLAELKKREKALAAQEKQRETLGAIQDEINKMLDMSDKLTMLADEVESEIGSGSFVEIHICDIGSEYLKIHRNVSDLAIKALLNEREIFRNYRVAG